MRNKARQFALCWLPLILLPLVAGAQNAIEADSLKNGRELAGLPVLSWDEQTGVMAGAMLEWIVPDKSGATYGLSSYAVLTQKGQQALGLEPRMGFWQDQLRLEMDFSWSHWPEDYYELGNNSPDSLQEVDSRGFSFKLELTREIRPRHYLGLGLKSEWKAISQAGERFRGGRLLGPGLIYTIDSRNQRIFPLNGALWRLGFWVFDDSWSSDFSYMQANVDLRHYGPLWRNGVLAFQFLWSRQWGEPSFRQFLSLEKGLRAYADNRFMDRELLSARLEIRQPLFWKVGVAAFAGIGQVIGVQEPALSNLRHSIGAGMRFRIAKEHQLNLSLDLALGRGSTQVVMTLGEAF